jgi:hypothetical protein
MRYDTIFGLILPISSTRSLRLNPIMNVSIALSSETSTAEFLVRLHLWMYALKVSSRCCTRVLTSACMILQVSTYMVMEMHQFGWLQR